MSLELISSILILVGLFYLVRWIRSVLRLRRWHRIYMSRSPIENAINKAYQDQLNATREKYEDKQAQAIKDYDAERLQREIQAGDAAFRGLTNPAVERIKELVLELSRFPSFTFEFVPSVSTMSAYDHHIPITNYTRGTVTIRLGGDIKVFNYEWDDLDEVLSYLELLAANTKVHKTSEIETPSAD